MMAVDEVSAIAERLACLRTRRASLLASLREIGSEVQGGNVARAGKVEGIRSELLAVEREIPGLERELAAARSEAFQRDLTSKRQRFRDVLAEIERQREQVIEHTRAASLALGSLPALQREATDLANALGTAPVAEGAVGCWPADRSAVVEAMRPIDPYTNWPAIEFLPVDVDQTLRIQPTRRF